MMKYQAAALSGFALVLTTIAATGPLAAQRTADPVASGEVIQSAWHDFRVVEIADGLINPHSIAFLPNGDVLVTERPGRLRIIRDDVLLPDPVEGLPPILALGQGAMSLNGLEQAGLREVRLHPDFEQNRLLYLSYVKPGAGGLGTLAVARGRYEDDRLSNVEEIFHAYAHGNGSERSSMWGGRLAFDGEGYLFITLGDRQWPSVGDLEQHPAQQLFNHNGTTLRIHDDGRVPDDNPFVGQGDARPEIWTYGHRNAQGLAIHPETGEAWLNEHGPQGGDEVNRLVPGGNYGWPVVGFGVNYRSGSAIHAGTRAEGMEMPTHVWVPSIGVSGMLFYGGAAFPEWRGDIVVGGMSGQRLVRLHVDGVVIDREEVLLQNVGRIRDVAESPEGHLYLAIDGGTRWEDGPPTKILRVEPAGSR